ncbi:MAG: BNR-4 repeat-containing protein, partial [Planctomycetales bacterium]|nr:BNR-4 repeat-containing protein [Planctomycetales bacterium]
MPFSSPSTLTARFSLLVALAAIVAFPVKLCAQFNLTNTPTAPNGVWSWFEDERAIIDDSDPSNTLLLVSSVSAGAAPENGDIDLLWRNLDTGAQGTFELHNQLQQDDHDSAALYMRPDGRYVAMFSTHGGDPLTRWRVSTNPHDPTSWGPEQTLNNGAGTTYNNTYYLPDDNGAAGRTYNFSRADNYDPIVQVSNDHGSTWAEAGKLLTEGGSGDRPYVRYASDGKKIHFITTERHPRNYQNSIYHGYVQNGALYDTQGNVIDGNLFDGAGAAPASLTPVFQNGSQFNGNTMFRAWTINLEVDNTGNPVGIFSARVNDSNQDHRFFYARYDGHEWRVHEMAKAGGYLYSAEDDYTGLASIDPSNPNVVYLSSDIDPRTGAGAAKYELYKGFTSDFGESWSWTAVTSNSPVDNIRPVVPEWDGQNTAVTWLQGNYNSYTNWDTQVVGQVFAASDPKSLLWRGDAASPTAWDENNTPNWDSGGGLSDVYLNGAEVAFDDTASSYTVNISATVSPMGVAFNNNAGAYVVTGAGIGGTGGLRVIGGGTVTLANADNTYSGDTLVANGTLALAGNATLSGATHIDVREGSTLDVTASAGGAYTLSNQTLTVDGRVEGDLIASNATITGSGSLSGDLTVHAGSTIQVGGAGITAQVEYTYVDADHATNTTLADGSPFNPVQPGAAAANLWVVRGLEGGQATLGNDGSVYQADPVVGGDDAPALRTTIAGLTPNTAYDVQVNFWDATGSEWRIRAGDSLGSLVLYDAPADAVPGAANGVDSNTVLYNAAPLSIEGNRTLYGAQIGLVTTDGSGNLVVYVDDLASGGDDRTWYDGLSYASGQTYSGQATVTIQGDLTLDATSTLKIDIGNQANHDR